MALILITGAAGRIGRALRQGLKAPGRRFRLADVSDLGTAAADEEIVTANLSDLDAVAELADGADAIIHLASLVGAELKWKDVLHNNIETTYNAFEAARLKNVRRVVFASSIHYHGFLPRKVQASADSPVLPDSLYGVAKVFGEATGRLYADKYGLEVVCLRIASFRPKPTLTRELGTWLSPNDAVRLFNTSLTAPNVHFEILYGTSKNDRSLYAKGRAAEMGYDPQDDSGSYAQEITAAGAAPEPELEARFHGAHFIPPGFMGDPKRVT